MKLFRLGALALLCALASASLQAQQSRGHDWVRANPFVLMALSMSAEPLDVRQYKGAGLTYMLAWKPSRPSVMKPTVEEKLRWFGNHDVRGQADYRSKIERFIKEYPGNAGWLLNDEPTAEEMGATGEALAWLREKYPDKLALSNLGGATDFPAHVRKYLARVRSDILVYDLYPYSPNHEGLAETDMYFARMGTIRSAALSAKIPYWAIVQSVDRSGPAFRLPYPYFSESDLRLQVFAHLTHGFSGIAFFIYDYWDDKKSPGFLNKDRSPSHLYRHAAAMNTEVRNLGEVIKHLTSTHVFAIPAGRGAKPLVAPAILPPWKPAVVAGDPVRSIEILNPDADSHGLMGYFEGDDRQRYLMVTNLRRRHGQEQGSARNTAQSFRIRFEPAITAVSLIDRRSGKPVPRAIANAEEGLVITLPGGTGDLMKLGSGR